MFLRGELGGHAGGGGVGEGQGGVQLVLFYRQGNRVAVRVIRRGQPDVPGALVGEGEVGRRRVKLKAESVILHDHRRVGL